MYTRYFLMLFNSVLFIVEKIDGTFIFNNFEPDNNSY